MEAANLVKELQLNDSGKLLVMFECAKEARVNMDETEVDAMAFLLNAKQALPFGYPFLLNPLPVSSELRQDVYNLIQTGYLSKGSPVYITRKGSDWVSVLLQRLDDPSGLLSALKEMMADLITEYRRAAFGLIYTAISG